MSKLLQRLPMLRIFLIEEDGVIKRVPKKEVSGGVEVTNAAEVGQILVVKAVDEEGMPVEWETVEPLVSESMQEVDIFPEQEVTFVDGSASLTDVKDPCYDLGVVEDYGSTTAILEINGEKIEGTLNYKYVGTGTFGAYNYEGAMITLGEGATVQNGDTAKVRLYVNATIISKMSARYLPDEVPVPSKFYIPGIVTINDYDGDGIPERWDASSISQFVWINDDGELVIGGELTGLKSKTQSTHSVWKQLANEELGGLTEKLYDFRGKNPEEIWVGLDYVSDETKNINFKIGGNTISASDRATNNHGIVLRMKLISDNNIEYWMYECETSGLLDMIKPILQRNRTTMVIGTATLNSQLTVSLGGTATFDQEIIRVYYR